MATYSQWRRSADLQGASRATWVCGSERILVEEVVDVTRAQTHDGNISHATTFHAGSGPDRDIWDTANQHDLRAHIKLVIVRDAEKIKRWEPLGEWLNTMRSTPKVHLLFVSNDPDYFVVDKVKKSKTLQPYAELLRAKTRRVAQIVRCSPLNEADAIAWARRRAPQLDEEMARYLLTRTGGNLWVTGAVCGKLFLFPGLVGKNVINQLCGEAPSGTFVEALLMMRKPEAFLALETLSESEYGMVLGLLDSRLDMLAMLNHAARSGYGNRDVQQLPVFLVQQFMPIAKHYDEARCLHIRRVLAVVDSAYRSGARGGLMEALVALW